MKTKLLLPALLLTAMSFAQNTVPAFYAFTAQGATDEYTRVDSETDFNQAASTGANVNWNFNSLLISGLTSTKVIAPSASNIATFPGSNMLVQITTQTANVTRYFFAQNGNGAISLTGAETDNYILNYSTNNALIGTFPASYGYTSTDDVAGTFLVTNYNTTFTGTSTTTVDGYGTLTTNLGSTNGNSVTRVKNVQNLNLFLSGIPIGTATQTMYSYYSDTLLTGPVFRNIETNIVVPSGGIDYNFSNYELHNSLTASTTQVVKSKITLAPNPVNDILHFAGVEGISKVTVIDAAGRLVLSGNSNDIFAGSLSAGIYYATAETEAGKQTVKFIKK